MHDIQRLKDLRAGLDRGGAGRTWAEVAAIVGLSEHYTSQIAKHGRYIEPSYRVRIDPRDVQPQLKTLMDDAQVQAWQRHPHCLCGCAQPTRVEDSASALVPRGANRLYLAGHQQRMPWYRVAASNRSLTIEQRLAHAVQQRQLTIDAGMLRDLVHEWLVLHNKTADDLARLAHLAPSHVREIRTGAFTRVKPFTVGKLLAAMKQPMRPEIAEAYLRWMRRRNLKPVKIRVLE